MTQEILKRFEDDLRQSSAHTRKGRLFWCRKFLAFARGKEVSEWNKDLVYAFLKQLEAEGYSEGTIRLAGSIVRRVFDAAKEVHESERTRLLSQVDPANPTAVAEILKALSVPGPNWNLGKRWLPQVMDAVQSRLTMDEAEREIMAARKSDKPAVPAYLSLASVYALRREELFRVRQEDFDFSKGTFFVHTAKGGEQRHQLLSPIVIPYLQKYSFSGEYSLFDLSYLYYQVEALAGVDHRDGVGLHAFRHLIDTELRDIFGKDALAVKIFLRWRLSRSPDMSDRYYNRDPLAVDEAVLKVHPLLPFWR